MDNKIYEKLNDIKDLEDRKLLKKIMNNVFSALEDYTEEKLKVLEKRVFDEIEYKKDKYTVYSTIIKKEEIDPTNEFLYPILEEDMEDTIYETDKILESLRDNKNTSLFKVFLKCDYLTFKNILKTKQIEGKIETDKNVYKAYFKLKENKEYINKVSRLYETFIKNNIPWTTMNMPYIHKIADVILVDHDGHIEKSEKIIKIDVDFKEDSKYVKYNMIPFWNIERLILPRDGFPIPCEDKINYEHNVSIVKQGKENGYLVEYNSENVSQIIFKEESFVIVSKSEEIKSCEVLKFIENNNDKYQKYDYELMTNEVTINFANKLSMQNSYAIKTKVELIRIINSFKASKDLKLIDVKLEKKLSTEEREIYDINDFIIDEIREDQIEKSLILYFKPINKDNYLNNDILSFLVSEIQLIYPEYNCEGRLI